MLDLVWWTRDKTAIEGAQLSILCYIQTAIIILPTANLILILNIHLHMNIWFGTKIAETLKVLKNPSCLLIGK